LGEQCSCLLQGECVLGVPGKPYTEQAVDGEWNVKDLIGGTEEQDAIQLAESKWLGKKGVIKKVLRFQGPCGEEEKRW
jgi:hypothetical protein